VAEAAALMSPAGRNLVCWSEKMKLWAFVNKALAEGYCMRTYWIKQYRMYMRGNRGPDMHDFTLANLSA